MLLIQKNLFSKFECDKITNLHIQNPINWVQGDRKYTSYDMLYDEDNKWVYDKLSEFFITETSLNLKEIKKNIHFHRFVTGDKFELHNDVRDDRLFGVGVLLNDDYDGGSFSFYNPNKVVIENKIGQAYIFDVRIQHQVDKILFGERLSLLWFLQKKHVKYTTDKLL